MQGTHGYSTIVVDDKVSLELGIHEVLCALLFVLFLLYN